MGGQLKELKPVAQESLDTLSDIADAAAVMLKAKGLKPDDLANPNTVTSPTFVSDMQNRNLDRTSNLQALRQKPAIARLVIADEEDNRETLFIAPNAEVSLAGKKICSYLANRGKGRLLALGVGEDIDCELPGGPRNFTVLEKLTFEPRHDGEWDSTPAIQFREKAAPLTIKSLREILREAGLSEDDFDLDGWAEVGTDDENIIEGIQRHIRTAMELRLNPYLDRKQEKIFRLPLVDQQIAVLGPPGTGKTTTLVRRLRQKIDLAALDPDDADKVEAPDKAGRNHAESWLMFTPTELLRQYVREAMGKEGVPVHDDQIKTWDAYRTDLAKKLRILRTVGGGGGLILNADPSQLQADTFSRTAEWFTDFDVFQRSAFIAGLRQEAERIAGAGDAAAARLGRQTVEAVDRADGDVLRLLAEFLAIRDQLREQAARLRGQTQDELKTIIGEMRKQDPNILEDLEVFVAALLAEQDDDADDQDNEDDDDEDISAASKSRNRKAILDVFLKALRTTAIARANSRKPAPSSRAGRVLAWLAGRDTELPDLRELGKTLLVQRALGRIARAPTDYLGKMALRYRSYRRQARSDGRWYGDTKGAPANAHPAEIDCLLLGILRGAREMEADRLVSQRLGDDLPVFLIDIGRERRNQVLVDEATDFSPVQLACMFGLTDARTHSLFLSGDFNQRLTLWGSRSGPDLEFVCPDLVIERISVTYRQSEKLAQFAAALADSEDNDSSASMPEYSKNLGVDPVRRLDLSNVDGQAEWLAQRVHEIVSANDDTMPTIAVLLPGEEGLDAMANALTEKLNSVAISAVAYNKGVARGLDQEIRVFSVEHIKGLEFEAVFFVGVDKLAEAMPKLFERYLYVGATRAATYLGLTSGSSQLPGKLEDTNLSYAQQW